MVEDPHWRKYAEAGFDRSIASIKISGMTIETVGLQAFGNAELTITVEEPSLVLAARGYLATLANYIASGAELTELQTVACGSWLLEFRMNGYGKLEAWEFDRQAERIVFGATFAISLWRSQLGVCEKLGVDFLPARMGDLVWLSSDVFESRSLIHGEREAFDGMSGWWLNSEDWDRDPKKFRKEHVAHVVSALPELARFLALPSGYHFTVDRDGNVVELGFDAALASKMRPAT